MFELSIKIRRILMLLTIVNLSVFIYWFMNQFYMPFIFLAYLQFGLFFLDLKPGTIEKVEISFILFALAMFFFASFNPERFRLSTILYSCLFITTFLYYRRGLKKNIIRPKQFLQLIRYIIYAYAIVILVQQVQFYLHMEVFNGANWQTTNSALDSGLLKFNSLALEASNVPLVLTALFYAYITIQEVKRRQVYSLKSLWKENKIIMLFTIFTILSTRSTTAIFILSLLLIRYLNFKSITKYLPVICLTLFSLILIVVSLMPRMADRFINIINFLIHLDYKGLISVDGSAACRIIPHFIYWEDFDIFNLETWIGHGIDSLKRKATFMIVGDSERSVGAENIMCFAYDYGLVMAIWLFTLMKSISFKKILSYDFLLYLFGFSILTLNHYVFWLYMTIMYTANYYKKRYKNISFQ